ncbi:hypothetical protein GCM10027203_79970 [Nonomuraea fastidiosa]|jgi:hypothetical protein
MVFKTAAEWGCGCGRITTDRRQRGSLIEGHGIALRVSYRPRGLTAALCGSASTVIILGSIRRGCRGLGFGE